MLTRFLFLLGALLVGVCAQAQQQASIWYFGQEAGLDFRQGAPVPLLDGKLATYEGSAVATTSRGQLLFYTNGVTVWNRKHEPMLNGKNLTGSKSSSQSALIVPDPGSGNIFYVFTTAAEGTPIGMRFSVVDMAAENGLGDVKRSNLLLISPVAEKLTAVRHRNGRDIWVIGHRWNSSAFVSYLVTPDGVETKPILSNVGSVHAGPGRNAIGCMKASPDGSKLAVAIWREGNKVEVFNFDNATGLVKKPKNFSYGPFEEAYGVEFSPDGTKLYATSNGNGGGNAQVWQVDLASGTILAIGNSANRKIGSLQLGPDGRIYVAREDNRNLGVIENPNAAGLACKYVDDGIHLGGRRSKLGLPNFVQSYFK